MSTIHKKRRKHVRRGLYPKVVQDIFLGECLPDETKLSMRGYCQTDWYRCGVSAGWSVLKYFNKEAKFKKFEKICKAHPLEGTAKCNLQKALKDQGVRTVTKRVTFNRVKQSILDNKPILMSIHCDGNVYHWITIYGFSEKPKTVYIIGRVMPGFSKKSFLWKNLKKLNCDVLPLIASHAVSGARASDTNSRRRGSR